MLDVQGLSNISSRRSAAVDEEDGNPVRRVLQRVDRSLDELEADAPPLVEAVWAVSNSPIAHAAGKGVTVAAKVQSPDVPPRTYKLRFFRDCHRNDNLAFIWCEQVGRDAALLAVPVGKWALQRGFNLAVGAIAAGGRSSSSRSRRAKDSRSPRKPADKSIDE